MKRTSHNTRHRARGAQKQGEKEANIQYPIKNKGRPHGKNHQKTGTTTAPPGAIESYGKPHRSQPCTYASRQSPPCSGPLALTTNPALLTRCGGSKCPDVEEKAWLSKITRSEGSVFVVQMCWCCSRSCDSRRELRIRKKFFGQILYLPRNIPRTFSLIVMGRFSYLHSLAIHFHSSQYAFSRGAYTKLILTNMPTLPEV